MRPLEIALITSAVPYIIRLLSGLRGGDQWLDWVPGLVLVVAICHLFAEGYRWQMLPAYALAVSLVVYAVQPWSLSVHGSYLAGTVMGAAVLFAVLMSTIYPVFSFPPLTGPYKVGTQSRHIVDLGRPDPFGAGRDGWRELMIQFWYPANESARGTFALYRHEQTTTARNARLALVRTRSILDAPVSHVRQRYPILIYTPSWSGLRTENTFQAEELASHGYIVVGIDHPYGSKVVVFPDGRIIHTKMDDGDGDNSGKDWAKSIRIAEEEVNTRALDTVSVLNALEEIDRNDERGLFEGHLDLGRVGIFGYSLGGAVAAQACWLDARFRAGVNMDGMILADAARHGVDVPFLFLLEDGPWSDGSAKPSPDPVAEFDRLQLERMRQLSERKDGQLTIVPGTRHGSFSDFPFYTMLRARSGVGSVDPKDASRVNLNHLRQFFDRFIPANE